MSTKQINELNDASEISGSDMLALAQSGKSEATRATVADLAAAVGELNSKGALSELELATSIGKNVLAQSLTAKGIETSPNETLLAMANKVATLNDNMPAGFEVLTTKINTLSCVQNGNSLGYGVEKLPNGWWLKANQTEFNFIPPGNYTSLEDLGSSVLSTCTLQTKMYGLARYYAFSNDMSKLVVLTAYDTAGYDVYDVAWDTVNGVTLTYKKSRVVTTNRRGGGAGTLAINNDATLVFYKNSPYSNYNAYFESLEANFSAEITNVTMYQHDSTKFNDETNVVTVYHPISFSGEGASYQANGRYSLHKQVFTPTITRDAETGEITAITATKTSNSEYYGVSDTYINACPSIMRFIPQNIAIALTVKRGYYTHHAQANFTKAVYASFDLIDFSEENNTPIVINSDIKIYQSQLAHYNGNTVSIPSSSSSGYYYAGYKSYSMLYDVACRPLLSLTPLQEVSTGVFKFKFLALGVEFTYNRNTHTLTSDSTETEFTWGDACVTGNSYFYGSLSSGNYWGLPTFYDEASGTLTLLKNYSGSDSYSSISDFNNYISTVTFDPSKQTDDQYIFGFKWKRGDKEIVLTGFCFDDLADAKMGVDVVQLPEHSREQYESDSES